jgi:hypothetical protein
VPIQYGLAKSSQIHLVKELAIRLRKQKIRANAVSFGGVQGRASEVFERKYGRFTLSGKMLDPEQVFGPVQFLSSDASSGMNGQNLVIDEGWTIW